MVATSCVRRPPRSVCSSWARRPSGDVASPLLAGSEATSSATATKDSQKPGCSKAQGSPSVTTKAAASSTKCSGQRRPALRSSTTTAIIPTVRWAGTPQPASSA